MKTELSLSFLKFLGFVLVGAMGYVAYTVVVHTNGLQSIDVSALNHLIAYIH